MTVGVNISHDASICIKKEDSVEFFEESRFNKNKGWEPTAEDFDYKSFSKIKDFNDLFIFTSFGRHSYWNDETHIKLAKSLSLKPPFGEDELIIKNICKKYNIKNYFFNGNEHHIYHAVAGFYLAPFNEATCVVVDGGGTCPPSTISQVFPFREIYREVDSIYHIDIKKINPLYKKYSNGRYTALNTNVKNKVKFKNILKSFKNKKYESDLNSVEFEFNNCKYNVSSFYNPGLLFNHLCETIGTFTMCHNGSYAAPGKAMGLSSYGKSEGMRDEDLAKQVQEVTEEYTIDLIERALMFSDCKNIVLSGGYFLNCVNNYKYTQYFKNVNFFVDPCPHDGGTALGAALWYDNYK